jgi:hypothetical protein
MVEPTNSWAHEVQRGFTRGRNFLKNFIELDARARIMDIHDEAHLPLIILWDFMAAFPSLAHEYLTLAVIAAKILKAIINLVAAMYSCKNVYMCSEGTVEFMYNIKAGVLKGCPLGASLFVIALNVFLVYLDSLQLPSFAFRAAADDLGGVLRHIEHLIPLQQALSLLKTISGLRLHPPKVALIPLGGRRSNQRLAHAVCARMEHVFHQQQKNCQVLGLPSRPCSLGVHVG